MELVVSLMGDFGASAGKAKMRSCCGCPGRVCDVGCGPGRDCGRDSGHGCGGGSSDESGRVSMATPQFLPVSILSSLSGTNEQGSIPRHLASPTNECPSSAI